MSRSSAVARRDPRRQPMYQQQVTPETLMHRSHDRIVWLARSEGWLRQALCGERHPIWADRRCLLLAGHGGHYHKTGAHGEVAW